MKIYTQFDYKGFHEKLENGKFHMFSNLILTLYCKMYPDNRPNSVSATTNHWALNALRVMREETKCEQLSGLMSRLTVKAVRFNCIIPLYSMPQTAP